MNGTATTQAKKNLIQIVQQNPDFRTHTKSTSRGNSSANRGTPTSLVA